MKPMVWLQAQCSSGVYHGLKIATLHTQSNSFRSYHGRDSKPEKSFVPS